MPFYDVPGVYPSVEDRSQFSRPEGSTPCAVVGAFTKGPLRPVMVTSVENLIKDFGAPDPTKGLAAYCAIAALGGDDLSAGLANPRGTTQLWVRRVAHTDVTYAVSTLDTGAFVPDDPGIADPSARVWGSESFLVHPIGPGAWANGTLSVAIANLKPDVGFRTWVTATPYVVGEVVLNALTGLYYTCATAHTSAALFATDLAAVKWVAMLDVSWDLQVFADGNTVTPVEIWRCNKTHKIDGYGRQLFLEDAVNPYSHYIQVIDNPAVTANPTAAAPRVDFDNAADGSAVVDADVVTGWADFQDPVRYPCRVLINGGYSTPAVQQSMAAVAASRFDCIAALDMPTASQDPVDAALYRNTVLNLNSSFAAMFSPDYLAYDRRRGAYLYVPPSGAAARAFAYTDSVAEVWEAAAGPRKGMIPDAFKLFKTYRPGDIALIYNAQVNAIVRDGAYGVYIDGNRNLQAETSLMQLTSIRRLVNMLLVEGAKALKTLLFEQNSELTRTRAREILDTLYAPVKRRGGVFNYYIQCDLHNNPPDDIARQIMNVWAFIQPVPDVEFIPYKIIVNTTAVILPSQT